MPVTVRHISGVDARRVSHDGTRESFDGGNMRLVNRQCMCACCKEREREVNRSSQQQPKLQQQALPTKVSLELTLEQENMAEIVCACGAYDTTSGEREGSVSIWLLQQQRQAQQRQPRSSAHFLLTSSSSCLTLFGARFANTPCLPACLPAYCCLTALGASLRSSRFRSDQGAIEAARH